MKKLPTPKRIRSEIDLLCKLAVHAAAGDSKGLQSLAGSPAFKRTAPTKVVETILEVHLFAGFPAAIDAFFDLHKFLPKQRSKSRKLDGLPAQRTRGRNLCSRIYGGNFSKLMLNLYLLNKDLSTWIIDYGYGRVLSRPGLTIIERELIAVSVLAAQGWQRQLISHIHGALNIGVSFARLQRISILLTELVGASSASRYSRALEEAVKNRPKGKIA